jgi:hypothetical protein
MEEVCCLDNNQTGVVEPITFVGVADGDAQIIEARLGDVGHRLCGYHASLR